MRLESHKIKGLMKRLAGSYVQSCIVMCNVAEDVECGSYPNLSKNMIKIKHSLILSSFISVVGWSSLFLFNRLSGLNCQSSH